MPERTSSPQQLRELWRRFEERGDPIAREKLVVAYAPLVKWIAGRVAATLPPHIEESDLISYGLLGLTHAVDRFSSKQGVKFETFAAGRVRGAIIDELRAEDWVPRSVRQRAREIERTFARLELRLHRSPTDAEMAEALELSLEEFREGLILVAQGKLHALDELWSAGDGAGKSVSLLETIADDRALDPEIAMQEQGLRDEIGAAIHRLPERERLVVALYYYENLTLREVGEVLGVTESRASQLHTQAVLRLRARFGSDGLLHG